jgi:hypothetical protein
VVGSLSSDTDKITGVTYAGTAMSRLIGIQDNNLTRWHYIYGLLAPSTGANNVVVSASNTFVGGGSASYTGVNQSGLPDATATDVTGTSVNDFNVNITTVADNCWVFSSCGRNITTGGSMTFRVALSHVSSVVELVDTNGVLTPAGTKTLTFHQPDTNQHSALLVSFAPAASSTPTPNFLSLTGVGS